MSFRQIFVPLNGSDRDADALISAFMIAHITNTHVMAQFVRPDIRYVAPVAGLQLLPGLIEDISRTTKQIADETARAAHRHFTTAAIEAKASIVDRPKSGTGATASFREVEGFVFERVARAAKFSDLVVYGPLSKPEDFQTSAGFMEVLMTAKRPVLINPKKLNGPFRKIAIGWDGGHATARAICAAMPLITAAQNVEVITIQRPSPLHVNDFDELRDYLGLSRIHVTRRIVDRGARPVGEELIDAAIAGRADLLVIGGYGHSPLREALFGGTTAYDALDEPAIPLFLAH